MATNYLDNIWKLMTTYTFKMDSECGCEALLCVICNNIIIEAYQNICGCKYCYKCIKEYLKEENQYCPGQREDCKDVISVIDKNIIRNDVINKKISRVKVHCPNESCDVIDELINMEEHIRICVKQVTVCPYIKMGCAKKEAKGLLLSHLNEYTWQHTNLLIDFLENMRNDGDKQKEVLDMFKRELNSLKEDSMKKEKKIDDQEGILDDVLNVIKEMKKESAEKDKKIEDQGRILDVVLNVIKEIKKDSAEKEVKIEQLLQMKEEFEEEKTELKKIKEDFKSLVKESMKFQKETKTILSSLKEDSDKKDLQIKNILQEMTKATKSLEDNKEQSKEIKDDVETLKKKYKKYQEETKLSYITLKKESTKTKISSIIV